VSELELRRRCVPSFDLFNRIEQLRVVTQSASDRAQSADMLRMIPSSVVATAIRMRNEGDGHAACLLSNRLAPALNEKKYRAVAEARGAEAHILVKYFKAVETHDVLVGVYVNWIQRVECGSLHGNHRLRRRRVHAH
jgi:hypothetical protein